MKNSHGVKKSRIRIFDFLMFLLLAGLLPVAAIMALLYYRELSGAVLKGFDEKLLYSTESSKAFIDPEMHELMRNYRQAGPVVFSVPFAYAVEPIGGAVLRSTSPRGRFFLFSSFESDIRDVAFYDNKLVAAQDGENRLLVLDLFSVPRNSLNKITEIKIDHPCTGFAYDASGRSFICSGERNISILNTDGKTVSSITPEISYEGIIALTVNNSRIYVMSGGLEGHAFIYEISLPDGLLLRTVNIDIPDSPLGIDLYRDDFYITGTRSLFVYNSTGVLDIKLPPASRFDSRQTAFFGYISNILETVRLESNLTYLYTAFLTRDGYHIQYAADSTQDMNHSKSGYVDLTPAEEGIRDVSFKGDYYVSDIKYWEEWGLLKSGYSPIKNENRIAGFVGGDVDINIIEKRRKTVLTWVILSTMIALSAALLLLWVVSRSFLKPLEELHEIILGIAAGDSVLQTELSQPGNLKPVYDRLKEIREKIRNEQRIFQRDSKVISMKEEGYNEN